ncbi:WxcM-like domain-containing protein [Vibrio sp. NFV-1]|uniref:WxcM-like domain-containing protein n=1 Tax=Vibrio nitrifigilis TaxID=2789781 RepID=A0ABS0GFG9_9VIBR|nr:WxcM-like domain-containing protein [Vibrio nitrifigilis]
MILNKIKFKTLGDERGSLVAIEQGYNIPFDIKRVYYIFDTKKGVERGFHAHHNLQQLVIAINGSCDFIVDDGRERKIVHLDNPNEGLLVNGIVWREMKSFSDDCVLLVLADDYYNESDYIRDYNEFKELINGK